MTSKILILLTALTALASAQQKKDAGPPVLTVQQVKPGLFEITGAGANTEVRVTRDTLIVVDGKLPGEQIYNALMQQIGSIGKLPVKTLIVTQHHEDHAGNNDRFLAAGVKVLAHRNQLRDLATYKVEHVPALPNETYSGGSHTVKEGGVTVQLYHFGRGHTDGDSVVYFPDLKVIALSDLITVGSTGPRADYEGGGSFVEWPAVLEKVLKLDFDTCIPGAGDILTKADVAAFKVKMDTLVSRAREAVRSGVPKDQLMAHIRTDDLGWAPRLASVDPFYAELQKTAPQK